MKKFGVLLCLFFVFCFSFALVLGGNVFAIGEENESSQKAENIIKISSTDEFNAFAVKVNMGDESVKNANVKLECNLDFEGKTFTPLGTEDNPFVGTFDGFGYTLNNLKISNGGVFNFAKDATIKNLGADIKFYLNDTQQQTTNIGFVANANNCKIDGCKTSVIFKFSSASGEESANSNGNVNFGGIVALGEGSTISNCFSLLDINFVYSGNVLNEAYFGGIVGKAISGVVRNCYVAPISKAFEEERENINLRKTNSNSNFYFGGICGFVQGRNFKMFNNAFFGEQNLSNITIGGLIGKITNSSTNIPSSENLNSCKFYMVSNLSCPAIGEAPNGFIANSTLTAVSNYPQDKSFFEGEFWDEMYPFNFNSVWKDNNIYSGNVFYLPDLQQFLELTISLDNSSIFTLNFEGENVSVRNKQFKIGEIAKIEASFNVDEEKNINYADYYNFDYWDNGIVRTPFGEDNTLEIVVSNETAGNYKAVVVGKDINVCVTVRNEDGVSGQYGKVAYGNLAEQTISFVAKYADSSKVYKLQAIENVAEFKFSYFKSGDFKTASKTFSFKFDNITSNKLPISIVDGELVCNISAVFSNNTSELSVSVDDGGLISFENSNHTESFKELVVNNKEYLISATAREGYNFEGWFVNNELTSEENEITVQISSNTSYTAKFSKIGSGAENNTMLWIIIGCSAGGAVLIAGIVLIIVFSVKKKNKFSYKKNYRY